LRRGVHLREGDNDAARDPMSEIEKKRVIDLPNRILESELAGVIR
jgi:hypothetical protein